MWTNVDLDKNENENRLKYHPFLMASQNRWKCSCFYDLESGSQAIGHFVTSFQLDLWL